VIRVGVLGGSGYSGGEILRLLLGHPKARMVWITSRKEMPLEHIHKNLFGSGLAFVKPEEAERIEADVVFLCTPATVSMNYARGYLEKGMKVIDMSADFRLKDLAIYEKVYKKKHAEPELVKESVYGTTELKKEKIARCRLLANPGCYSITTILGLAPLVAGGLVDLERIVVDAKSGSSGHGAEPDVFAHHSEVGNSIIPYNVVKHRHSYEIEQELGELARRPVTIHFSCCYAPFVRGILSSCHAFVKGKAKDREGYLEVYKRFYKGKPFVQVLDMKKYGTSTEYIPYPSVANVAGSNYCQIGLDVDEERGRVVVFSATDNLVKGAAGSAIQNMNVMFGLDETTGLAARGLHPA